MQELQLLLQNITCSYKKYKKIANPLLDDIRHTMGYNTNTASLQGVSNKFSNLNI